MEGKLGLGQQYSGVSMIIYSPYDMIHAVFEKGL